MTTQQKTLTIALQGPSKTALPETRATPPAQICTMFLSICSMVPLEGFLK
jgi:hypothetical protein